MQELSVIKTALEQGRAAVQAELDASQAAADARANSTEIHRPEVAERLATYLQGQINVNCHLLSVLQNKMRG